MKTKTEEQNLDSLCRNIEERLPGICAAYKGFATPRPELDDGYITVELFNVPEENKQSILDECYGLADVTEKELSMPVLFMAWTVSETAECFAADVEKLRRERQQPVWVQSVETSWLTVELAEAMYKGEDDARGVISVEDFGTVSVYRANRKCVVQVEGATEVIEVEPLEAQGAYVGTNTYKGQRTSPELAKAA